MYQPPTPRVLFDTRPDYDPDKDPMFDALEYEVIELSVDVVLGDIPAFLRKQAI